MSNSSESSPPANDNLRPRRLSLATADALFGLAAEELLPDSGQLPRGASDYEIRGEIGHGGMGDVIAVEQPSIRREVAMKVLRAASDEPARLRFIEEAQITGQLEHPNIVPVHELARDARGQPYYTMKRVRGTTLAEVILRLADGDGATLAQYSLSALLTIFTKACDAVAFAHSRHVIHRDLKPENIMIGDYGEVLVMDWGLAKVLVADPAPPSETQNVSTARFDEGQFGMTLTGAVLGTPHYMAPEQARGENEGLDYKADIYALGAILYHLLVLRPAISDRDTRAAIDRVARGEIEPLLAEPMEELRLPHLPLNRVPESLAAVVRKAMEFRREDRYASVSELQGEVAAYQGGFATAAEKATRWRQMLLFIGRHKVASLTVAASVVLLTLLSLGFSVAVLRSERRATKARNDAEQAAAWLQAERADALFRVNDTGSAIPYLAGILRQDPNNALAAERLISALSWRSFPMPIASPSSSKAAFQTAEFSPDGRRLAVGWARTFESGAGIFEVNTGRKIALTESSGLNWHDGIFRLGWSADGRRFATASGNGAARVWDGASGKAVSPILAHPGRIWGVAFDPSGKYLLTTSSEGTAKVWELNAGRSLFSMPAGPDGFVIAEWSPAGDRILAAHRDGAIGVWDLTGTQLVAMEEKNGIAAAHFSQDGGFILTCDRKNGACRLWEAATGNSVGREIKPPSVTFSSTRLSPDGSRIVGVTGNDFAQVFETSSGREVAPPLPHRAPLRDAIFSVTGRQVLTGSFDWTARLWDADTGQPLCEPMRNVGRVLTTALSPEGHRALTVGELDLHVRLWDIRTGAARSTTLTHPGAINSLCLSPDGTRLLTTVNNAAYLWDVRAARRLGDAMTHGKKVKWAEFSPDGKMVATASGDGTARLWSAANGKPMGAPLTHPEGVFAAQFAPSGDQLWTCSSRARDTYLLTAWEVPGGKRITEWSPSGWFRKLEFSPDGKRIFLGFGGGIRPQLLDARSGESLANLGLHAVTLLGLQTNNVEKAAFSPDGEKLVIADSSSTFPFARIWSGLNGQPITPPLHHDRAATWAEFSPDGKRAVTASADGTVKIWDAESGEMLTQPLQHPDAVRKARFSTDGRRILTLCKDGLVRVWDASVGQVASEPLVHGGSVVDAVFIPGRHAVATAGEDGVVRLWEALEPPLPVPEWLPDVAEAASGTALDTRGIPKPLSADRLAELRERLAGEARQDFYGRWARWFFGDRSQRAIFPGSSVTVPDQIARLIKDDTLASLRAALELEPQHPLALARYAWRLLREPRESGERDRRAEAVYLVRLAAKLAPDDAYIQKLNVELKAAAARMAP